MILEEAGLDKNGDPIEGIEQPPKRKEKQKKDEGDDKSVKSIRGKKKQ